MTKPFQVFSEGEATEFLNLKETHKETHRVNEFEEKSFIVEAKFMRGEDKQIEVRRVVGIMEFLGEVGGIQQSLFIIGASLNFIFTGKD